MMDLKVFSNLSPLVFRAKDEKGEMDRLDVAIKRSEKVAKSVFSTPDPCFGQKKRKGSDVNVLGSSGSQSYRYHLTPKLR